MEKKKVVVMIPTYNERENIGPLIESLLKINSDLDLTILIVDDNSPDGTASIVQEIASKNPRVNLLLRTKRRGRGTAGAAGFQAALKLNPDYVIEMDGDGSHQPASIPELIKAAAEADIVLGSRYVPGGQDSERSFWRRLITWLVRLFIRWQFRLPVKDVSSGFRCFRSEALRTIDPEDLISTGPSIVLEVPVSYTHL
ncbi:MAG: polyprenol monophosphomannose synthase, partial [Candidatus Aminicenantes bacterium]|nr:polyprenol monophosphomannose synthase [Candidatus Aminicenantes bacterium]